jgi:mono/diheme cytochrome c family protein
VLLLGVACGVLATVIAATAAFLFWPWRIEATATPSAAELVVMRAILDRAVAREAPLLVPPFQDSAATLAEGLKIFRDNCAGCHGDGAQPSPWGASSFLPRVPQFGSHPPRRPAWQVHWIVSHGIRNTAMGSFAPIMTDDAIWKVSIFLSRLGSLPDDVASDWARPGKGP